jgi:hypothetical protein
VSRLVGLAVIASAGILGGCDRKPAELSGIGPWSVARTHLADASGRCEPTELPDGRKGTWCFGQPPLKIAGRLAEVDLYFLGDQRSAPLLELQLKVRGCEEEKLGSWLRTTFGPPAAAVGANAFWQNGFVWIAALMPSEPGRCLVRVLPIAEGGEIERIKASLGAGSAGSGSAASAH